MSGHALRRGLAIALVLGLMACGGVDATSDPAPEAAIAAPDDVTPDPTPSPIDPSVYHARQEPLPFRVLSFSSACRKVRSLPPDRVDPVERKACLVGQSVDGIRDWGPDVRSAKAGRAAWLYAHCATDDAIARDANLDLRDVEALTGPFAPDTLRKLGCPPAPGDEPVRDGPPLRIVYSSMTATRPRRTRSKQSGQRWCARGPRRISPPPRTHASPCSGGGVMRSSAGERIIPPTATGIA
ncbi:hypothetical protein ASE70_01920 [Sphingomonas sp. Leaf22]|uniref:hypothetical protein n=1 Tax=Sphingomonas sp. Leaf22 TaxID=1735687 RepID=UPI0006FAAE0A|nr:hypothetical protein [Sphingomonas sp. Leaf22]KQM90199.1 hypothetical protein ASE70_01920 [Sphingomonas sp. Leaf22]